MKKLVIVCCIIYSFLITNCSPSKADLESKNKTIKELSYDSTQNLCNSLKHNIKLRNQLNFSNAIGISLNNKPIIAIPVNIYNARRHILGVFIVQFDLQFNNITLKKGIYNILFYKKYGIYLIPQQKKKVVQISKRKVFNPRSRDIIFMSFLITNEYFDLIIKSIPPSSSRSKNKKNKHSQGDKSDSDLGDEEEGPGIIRFRKPHDIVHGTKS